MKPGIGEVVGGKYRIEEQLGIGAIGAVYRVRHVALKKQLALKVLLPEAARDHEAVKRFEREALVGAHVSHPNVAAAIDFGQLDDGSYYLVLELVRGVTLRDVVKHGPMPLRRALRVARGIAAGLAHLHERGIVHRDLKPANVMLVDGTSSDVKLIDFGLARVQADGTLGRELSTSSGQWQAITDHGNFFGTVAYLAPEVRHGMGAIDERSDLYALGVILCELFAGRRPFVAPSLVDVLKLHLHSKPPSLADLTTEPMPPALVALVDSLLHKDAALRPASAHLVAATLQDIVDEVTAATRARASTLPPPAAMAGFLALPGPAVDDDDDEPYDGPDTAPLAHVTGGYEALLGDSFRADLASVLGDPAAPSSRSPSSRPPPARASSSPPSSSRLPSAPASSRTPSSSRLPSAPPSSRPVPSLYPSPLSIRPGHASDRPPPVSSRPVPSPLAPPVAVTPLPPSLIEAAPAPAASRHHLRTAVIGGSLLVAGLLAGLGLARRPAASPASVASVSAAVASASASAASSSPAAASALASATAPRPDVSKAIEAVREATEARGGMRALAAVLTLGEADPAAFRRPEVGPLLVDLAAGLEKRGSLREVSELFDYLAPRPSGDGADALFAVMRRSTDQRVALRARESLLRSVQLGVVSPALRATLDLVDAPCTQKLTLVPRLLQEGDARTATELQALQTTDCQKPRGCCLRQSKAVADAVEQLASRTP